MARLNFRPDFQTMAKAMAVLMATPVLVAAPAFADDSSFIGAFTQDGQRGVIFTNFDIARHAGFVSTGNKMGLGSRLNQPGFRTLVMTGVAIGDRSAFEGSARARITQSRLMLGYEAHRDGFVPSFYVGLSQYAPGEADVNATRKAMRLGVAGMLDLWKNWPGDSTNGAHFTKLTLLVDSAEESLYLGLKHGHRIKGLSGSFGPEASISLGRKRQSGGITLRDDWQKFRLGLGWFELPVGRVTFSLSAGGEIARGQRPGPYSHMSARLSY